MITAAGSTAPLLADADVARMIDHLLEDGFRGPGRQPIGGDRADLVLAGCAIRGDADGAGAATGSACVMIAACEGMLTELMIDDGVWRRGQGRLRGGGSNG